MLRLAALLGLPPGLYTSAAGRSAVTRVIVCPVGRTWTCACRILWCMPCSTGVETGWQPKQRSKPNHLSATAATAGRSSASLRYHLQPPTSVSKFFFIHQACAELQRGDWACRAAWAATWSLHQCCRAQCCHTSNCVPRGEHMDLCLQDTLVHGSAAGTAGRSSASLRYHPQLPITGKT